MAYSLPIYLLAKDCGEVRRFSSVEELQINLERIDVENDEYLAWDANGLPLRLSIREPLWLLLDLNVSRPGLTLIEALLNYADAMGVKIAPGARDSNPKDIMDAIDAHLLQRSRRWFKKLI